MPRKAREKSATGMYHVMVRGLNKLPVFKQIREKNRILKLIQENLEDYEVEIYAYCIMPNHFHLLIKAEIEVLSSFMAKVLAAYAQYYNYKHNRIGYVFQDRYKSQCVEYEKYYWNCLRYIHLNAVKGKVSKNMLEYPYCSMKDYYNNQSEILHKNAFELNEERFISNQEFLEFHKMSSRNVFIDTREEMTAQRIEIAKDILAEMKRDLKQSEEEILEYVKHKDQFVKHLMDVLSISKREAQNIKNMVKSELGTR